MKTSTDSFDEVADSEALLGRNSDGAPIQASSTRPRMNKCSVFLWTCISTMLGLIVGLWVGYNLLRPSSNQYVRQTTQSTPLLEDISIQYSTHRFNGSFMQENIYRRKASPEVDAAWEALGVNYRPVTIPVERAQEAGLRKDHVQINPKYGGGYPANVEGLHHLHCLNLLRQALYYNFDYYSALGLGAFKNNDEVVWLHVTHCLDIIRQQLMCTVDVGVFGQVWYRPAPGDVPAAFVDFNTNHKCRNYEDIRRWAEARQLPEEPPEDFLRPPGPGTVILDGVP